ncbi:hypothetical protein AGOR_G00211920 [Albula goreensis]|uniref:Uncharacterized protein n=1 Tax=Albula goreensis TaxID=1534307 RepID=A0A8T3CR70_9TELE|nr:hypothetical protein AGOR_G00211920 [Albula goreensis]
MNGVFEGNERQFPQYTAEQGAAPKHRKSFCCQLNLSVGFGTRRDRIRQWKKEEEKGGAKEDQKPGTKVTDKQSN